MVTGMIDVHDLGGVGKVPIRDPADPFSAITEDDDLAGDF